MYIILVCFAKPYFGKKKWKPIQDCWIDVKTMFSLIDWTDKRRHEQFYNGCVAKESELIGDFRHNGEKAASDAGDSRECVMSSCNQMLVRFSSDIRANNPESLGRPIKVTLPRFTGIAKEATHARELCHWYCIAGTIDDGNSEIHHIRN